MLESAFSTVLATLSEEHTEVDSQNASLATNLWPTVKAVARFAGALLYLSGHAFLLIVLVMTLNCTLNSYDSSLLILLNAINFTEIKSTVFKVFRPAALFQLTCSDITERFQLIVFMTCITLLNIAHISTAPLTWLRDSLLMFALVLMLECVVDYIKHAFICKFNKLTNACYRQFEVVLHGDYLLSYCGQRARFGSPLSRRFGFPLLPMVVLALLILHNAFANSRTAMHLRVALGVLVFACAVCLSIVSIDAFTCPDVFVCILKAVTKCLLSVILCGRSARIVLVERRQQQEEKLDEMPLADPFGVKLHAHVKYAVDKTTRSCSVPSSTSSSSVGTLKRDVSGSAIYVQTNSHGQTNFRARARDATEEEAEKAHAPKDEDGSLPIQQRPKREREVFDYSSRKPLNSGDHCTNHPNHPIHADQSDHRKHEGAFVDYSKQPSLDCGIRSSISSSCNCNGEPTEPHAARFGQKRRLNPSTFIEPVCASDVDVPNRPSTQSFNHNDPNSPDDPHHLQHNRRTSELSMGPNISMYSNDMLGDGGNREETEPQTAGPMMALSPTLKPRLLMELLTPTNEQNKVLLCLCT